MSDTEFYKFSLKELRARQANCEVSTPRYPKRYEEAFMLRILKVSVNEYRFALHALNLDVGLACSKFLNKNL